MKKKDTIFILIFLLIVLTIWNLSNVNATTKNNNDKKNIIIALLDTGIDYNHDKIKNNIMYDCNMCPIGKNFIDAKKDFKDDNGHGTHLAGILSNIADSKVSIITAKVLDYYGKGRVEDTVKAIKWAVDNDANIVLISLGTPFYNNDLKKAVSYAWGKGCFLVSAAGNSGREEIEYPAGNLFVLGVGAASIDENDRINKFKTSSLSNRGRHISIIAPGENIISTLPTYSVYANKFGLKMYKDKMNGTSQACAYVAAIAAKIWYDNPKLTNKELYNFLLLSTLNNENGLWTPEKGYGLIDINKKYEYKKTIPRKYGGIYGQVTDKKGEPITNAIFFINGISLDTKNDGFFRQENITPGKYKYSISLKNKYLTGEIMINSGYDTLLPIVVS